MKKFLAATATAIGLMAGVPAHAELIANGGFETGDLTGWSGTGAVVATAIDEDIDDVPHGGVYAAYFNAVGNLDGISQEIVTVAGNTYNFSFWYASDGQTQNAFQAYFGDKLIFDVTNDPAHGYVQENFVVTASSANTLISFLGQNDPSNQALDDVSVDAVVPPAAIPEPTTATLLGLGLLGVAMSRRKAVESNKT